MGGSALPRDRGWPQWGGSAVLCWHLSQDGSAKSRPGSCACEEPKGHGESTLDATASTNLWAPPASFIITGGREMKGVRLLPVSPPPRADTVTAAF